MWVNATQHKTIYKRVKWPVTEGGKGTMKSKTRQATVPTEDEFIAVSQRGR